MSRHKKKVVVVGGGPVGSLTAIFLSRKGFQVEVYDSRCDLRQSELECGRSMNLTLSLRGITALKKAGVDQDLLSMGIPMHSRCIHLQSNKQIVTPYGSQGEHAWSVNRSDLTELLLSAAERESNIKLHFQHKLLQIDPSVPCGTFARPNGEIITHDAKVIFGCDGAYSTVRRNLLKTRMDFKQVYVEYGYKELSIPPSSSGDYALNPNHFHLWPRKNMHMLALPNLDKSFTCNIFMPFSTYDEIITGEDVVKIFESNFNDVVPVIGEKALRESFNTLPTSSMITVYCTPHNYGSTAVLIGDAAHAMLPFSTQGLNCGLEGALLFDETMEKLDCDFERVLPTFSQLRVEHCHAAADYSLQMYFNMRSRGPSLWRSLCQKVHSFLQRSFPNVFTETYHAFSFTRAPYREIVRKEQKHSKVVEGTVTAIGCLVLGLLIKRISSLAPISTTKS